MSLFANPINGRGSMFCSTIIATIDRSTLPRAVQSVLEQDFPGADFEIIVVNDSGASLAAAAWQSAPQVRVIHTNRRRVSVARNTGAAIARGAYLHFLDDDDWLLPGALRSFWELTQRHPHAVLAYGTGNLVDEDEKLLGQVNLHQSGNCAAHLMAGSWIQCGSSVVKVELFFKIGGFSPLFPIAEETHFQRLLALQGNFVYTLAPVVNILRGAGWRTTVKYVGGPAYNRISRDLCLSESDAFSRLRASADSAYWQGRVFHAYLTATRWNLARRSFLVAASRALYAAMSLLLAGKHLFSADFWRAVRDAQVSCTADRILGR
ncbi:MAG: glycosyltransferase family 2 protein [Chloroflexi bacterium]|nr:glycosyltransferase family 2 protein [Chloroflexota bacterium]